MLLFSRNIVSSDFGYAFRSFQSTLELLAVVSDRIGRSFNMSAAIQTVALDISKAFNKVLLAGVFCKLKSFGISV